MSSGAIQGVPYEEQIHALETRIKMSREAAANLEDNQGQRISSLDMHIRSVSKKFASMAVPGLADDLASVERVADLTLLQLSLYTKQNDALKHRVQEVLSIGGGGGGRGGAEGALNNSALQAQVGDRDARIKHLEEQLMRSRTIEPVRGGSDDSQAIMGLQNQLMAAEAAVRDAQARAELAESRLGGGQSLDSSTVRAGREDDLLAAGGGDAKQKGRIKELVMENRSARESAERLQRSLAAREIQLSELEAANKGLEAEIVELTAQHESSLKDLQSKVESLRGVADAASNQGPDSSAEVASLKREVASLKARGDSQSSALEQASRALEASFGEIQALKGVSQGGQAAQEVVSLRSQVGSLRAELDEARSMLGRGHAKSAGDANATAMLRHENETLRRRMETMDKAAASRGVEVSPVGPQQSSAAADEVSRLRHELAGMTRQYDSSTKEVLELRRQLDAQAEEITRVQRSLTEISDKAGLADRYKDEAGNLQLQLTSVQQVLKTHSTNMQAVKGERDRAIAESARLVEQLAQCRSTQQALETELARVNVDLANTKSAEQHVGKVVVDVKGELSNCKRANAALEASQRELEVDNEGMSARITELERKEEAMSGELGECQKYIISLTAKLNEYVEDDAKKAEVEGHTNTVIAKLRAKNEQLVQELRESQEERDNLMQENTQNVELGKEAEVAISRLTERMSDYAMQIRKRDQEEKNLRMAIQDLEDALQESKKRCVDSEARIDTLASTVNARDASLMMRDDEIKRLEEILASASSGGPSRGVEVASSPIGRSSPAGSRGGSPVPVDLMHQQEVESLRRKVMELTRALVNQVSPEKKQAMSPGEGAGGEAEYDGRSVVLEEIVEQCKEVIGQQEREIEKLKGQVKSAREENRQEVSVLTQHNITLSKALKALRDQDEGFMGTKGERAKLSEELHAALQRGHEIQIEKDRALDVASKAVADLEASTVEAERLRSEKVRLYARVRSAKMYAAARIIQGLNTSCLETALARWIDEHERSKTERILIETMGHNESFDNLRWKEREEDMDNVNF